MSHPRYRSVSDLPDVLTVFPLPGVLLLPRWQLPLNIFEPRYLNMVDDAMHGNRLIGMIQPVAGSKARPDLAEAGCAGRITSWTETSDDRYLITLTGLIRFRLKEELSVTTPYRQIVPSWAPYAEDLFETSIADLPDRARLIGALQNYVQTNDIEADWTAIETAPVESLISTLCAGCPFSIMEKQALLEAPTLKDRAETLIKLLEMDVSGQNGGMIQ